jgi:hypothetical protein
MNALGVILSVNRRCLARAALRRGSISAETAVCVVTFGKPLIYRKFSNGAGDENVLDVTTLNVADHCLKNLIHDRRASRYSAGFVVMEEVLRCKGIWRDLLC